MTEHPILFKAEMVRAIRREIDPKTHTRRPITFSNSTTGGIVKRKDWHELQWDKAWFDDGPSPAGNPGPYWHVPFRHFVVRVYPRVQPGDKLWVREAFRYFQPHGEDGITRGVQFRVDGELKYVPPLASDEGCLIQRLGKWRPSIHMPRWASRIDLDVLKVGSQWIQDMPAMDAIQEGIPRSNHHLVTERILEELGRFRILWDSINASRGYGWDTNHPVWIYEFKRTNG